MQRSERTSVSYATPHVGDHAALRAMARQSFSETFGHRYDAGPFDDFLESAYGTGGTMHRDLNDPLVHWRAAFVDAQPVGYAKLTPLRAPVAAPLPGAVELQQIYVLTPWHGQGVAAVLMDWALATAAEIQAPEVYLTVFDHNVRAKNFYRRYGFSEVGHCQFILGERIDDDRVWRRRT